MKTPAFFSKNHEAESAFIPFLLCMHTKIHKNPYLRADMSDSQLSISNRLTEQLKIQVPVIMAPMFLVSNLGMMKAAIDSGIMGTFPTLNYRDKNELGTIIDACHTHMKLPGKTGSFGVNVIVQQSNIYLKDHLKICMDKKVPYYITSLGNPAEVIAGAHAYGGKVFCDVTTMKHAKKVVAQGCDGLIAVGQGAGGHAGNIALQVLIPALKKEFPKMIVVGAGGVANGQGLASLLALGADGASVGTRFIACTEATVNPEYKDAILKYGMEDIVMTEKISGTPCAVINTPYVQKIGTKQNFVEHFLNKNSATKKLFKTITQFRGMKVVEKAAMKATYKTVWCAGQTVELIQSIEPTQKIIENMIREYASAVNQMPKVQSIEIKQA